VGVSETLPPQSWASSVATRKSMRGNTRRDTSPEWKVRRLLHARGLRYRVDLQLPFDKRRRADITFTRAKVMVFIDGCFWHACPEHYVAPKAHPEYWGPKIAANRARDVETTQRLQADGWTVLRFWEHEDPESVALRVAAVVGDAAMAAAPAEREAAGLASSAGDHST
jgi:DNA mismatch endonuclease (patch repair protein)